mgnify:CR=1 FL=1
MSMTRILSILLIYFVPLLAHAGVDDFNDGNLVTAVTKSLISSTAQIEESHTFFGLASFYNNTNYYVVSSDGLHKISEGDSVELKSSQWLAVVARFNVGLIHAVGNSVHLDTSKLIIDKPATLSGLNSFTSVVNKSELPSIAPELDQIRYAHLWWPLAWLAKVVESLLVSIQSNIVSNWGFTIVIFSILLKFILLPVGIMTVRFQRRVSQVQAQLAPKLSEIKANYDGEEAHNYLIAAHKDLGVSPFYTLKPVLGSFIQIPILIVVFNVLGEMPQFVGQPFLWIGNLAYPDIIGPLPFIIPMLGDTVNPLPFIMTVITLYSTIIFQNRYAPKAEMRRQKRNLYYMATVFFVLFYPFPAVMVLYWAVTNFLHIIQQQFIKI